MLNSIVRSSIVQGIFTLISIGISFVLTPLLIRGLGDHRYGLWVLIGTVTSYLGLSDAGMAAALQNHLAIALGKGDAEEYRRVFSSGVVVYLVLALLMAALLSLTVVTLWMTHHAFGQPQVLLWSGVCCGLHVVITLFVSPYASVLVSQLRMDRTAWIAIGQSVVTAVLMLLSVQWHAGVVGLSAATLAGGLMAAIATWHAARGLAPQLRFDRSAVSDGHVRGILRYSGKKLIAQMADILRFRVDELVTGVCISLGQVTHYSVAFRLAMFPNDLQGRLMSVLNPVFARYIGQDDSKRLQRRYWLSLKVSMVLATGGFAAMVLLGHDVIRLWVGSQYEDAYVPLVLLSAALWVALCQTPSVNLFYATNTHQQFAYVSLREGVANLLLSLVFVLRFKMGIVGVALGTLAPMVVTKLLIQPSLALRLVRIPVSRFYLLMAQMMLPLGLSCTLIAVAAHVWLKSGLAKVLIVSLLLCLVCGGHLVAALTSSERQRMSRETAKRIPAFLRTFWMPNAA